MEWEAPPITMAPAREGWAVEWEVPQITMALAKTVMAEGLLATPVPVDIVSTALGEVDYKTLAN